MVPHDEVESIKKKLFIYKAGPFIRRKIVGTNMRLISGFHCSYFLDAVLYIQKSLFN